MFANEVRSKTISIGCQINPNLFPKLSVNNNVIEKERFIIKARKHTLLDICQKLLIKHSKFMQLNNDEYFENLDQKTLQRRLINTNEFKNEISVKEIKTNLKKDDRIHQFQI